MYQECFSEKSLVLLVRVGKMGTLVHHCPGDAYSCTTILKSTFSEIHTRSPKMSMPFDPDMLFEELVLRR